MNSNISVYDDKIPYIERYKFWYFCVKSTYTLGWEDSHEPEKYQLSAHSIWTVDELQSSGIYPYIQNAVNKTDWFTKKEIDLVAVNLVRSDDVHYAHIHDDTQVVLYYVNLDWKDGWYGETIFYEPDDINSIAYTSTYTPGRFILFDGSIPHAIRPQSVKAPKFRFSLSCFFK